MEQYSAVGQTSEVSFPKFKLLLLPMYLTWGSAPSAPLINCIYVSISMFIVANVARTHKILTSGPLEWEEWQALRIQFSCLERIFSARAHQNVP